MKFLARNELERWLRDLSMEQRLFAPVEEDGVLLYKQVEQLEEIVWDFLRPVKSIKEILFPQTEHLMTFEKHDDEVKLTNSFRAQPTVIFGVRSCDARGALVLDKVLIEAKPEERYYQARRKNTILIGLACKQMGDTCFCTSVGGSPDDSTGMDVMLHEVEGGYLVEVVSKTGEEIVAKLALQESELPKPIFEGSPEFRIPVEEVWRKSFKSPLWSEAADRCLSCRICAYVCPTCRCFDVRDEKLPSHNGNEYSERVRCWDSCSGEVYRRIAGGHNPREAKADRLRNRVYCKLYYIKEQSGYLACTGCGRCVESCPVNIDITEIMEQLVEGAPV
jgi:formate hydrogenlyase subunit 6/NADH:ubiquinone oxidoreductase subunit I